MKKLSLFIYILMLLYCLSVSSMVNAQSISVIDVEKSTDSYSRNDMYTTLDMFAEMNGVFYFSSNDGIHGRELWRSDGTEEGTWLVKDINPDTASANVNDIVVSGNKIFFSANDGVNGQQLWVSDGTSDSTYMLSTSFGFNAPAPSYITDVNGTAFFTVTSFNHKRSAMEVGWNTPGNSSCSRLFSFSTFSGYNIRYLTNVNGKLFFTANNFFSGVSGQLYVSDGTTSGTSEVLDNNSFEISNASNLTALNGSLYFSAFSFNFINNIYTLWVSDGTSTGTHTVKNVNNISLPQFYNDDNQRPFTVKDKTLFFQGIISNTDNELFKYDAADTAKGIRLVRDIVPGAAGSFPDNIRNVNGTIFFTTSPFNADAALWKTDGTYAGTRLVKDINPGGPNYYYGLVPYDSILMFVYSNGKQGFDLWKTNGTAGGTVMVKDIFPGVYSSFPQFITYHGDQFLFTANDGDRGFELWKSNGMKEGTTLIKDINTSFSGSSNPFGFTPLNNNTALFTAYTNQYGYEAWKTDGTDTGTKVVKDVYPGAFGSYPQFFTNLKNSIYFFAGTDSGYYLCKTDGTDAGTSLLYRLNVNSYVEDVATTDNFFYFVVYNFNTNTQELWRSNGTAAGTYAIKADIPSYFALNPVGVGKTLFFVYTDGNTGTELWKTNGTTIGTKLVKDINPGFNSSYPFNLYNFNGKLYFAADSGNGPLLWTSDGTPAGTKLFKAAFIQSTPFALANGKLFFSAFSVVANGTELYATDGTKAGTRLVKDVNKGPASSYPYSLVNGKALLYFLANSNNSDTSQLWVSDGTKEGTHKVTTFTFPNFGNTNFTEQVNVNDKLFFTLGDTLWQSDATEAGTQKVNDPILNGVNNIHGLSSIGNRLYFSGFYYTTGQELYTATVDSTSAPTIIITKAMVAPATNTFDVKLLSNPIGNQLRVLVNAKGQQVAQVMIIDALGRVLASAKQTLPAGTTVLSYETTGWTQGIYLVKIVTADGHSAVLKAMK